LLRVRAGEGTLQFWATVAAARPIVAAASKVKLRMMLG
jgi:hypothetical protein